MAIPSCNVVSLPPGPCTESDRAQAKFAHSTFKPELGHYSEGKVLRLLVLLPRCRSESDTGRRARTGIHRDSDAGGSAARILEMIMPVARALAR